MRKTSINEEEYAIKKYISIFKAKLSKDYTYTRVFFFNLKRQKEQEQELEQTDKHSKHANLLISPHTIKKPTNMAVILASQRSKENHIIQLKM